MTQESATDRDSAANQPGMPDEEFIELFSRYQRRLYLYILAQMPRVVDAEEVLQETNIVLWKKSATFRPGTNFFAWACQIAHYEVLKYRQRRGREKLRFSDDFVEIVASDFERKSDEFEARREALADCLRKLRPKDRELIQHRYAPGENGKSTAEWLGRPVNAVYQSLGRIRRTLMECITRRLSAEAGP